MMNPKNLKKQQGFTLVEVIVVAIIVAALAAVAIPLYNGYVTSSKNNAAANAAGSVASFMGACINQGGTAGDSSATALTDNATVTGANKVTCIGTSAPATQMPSIAIPAGISVTISKVASSPGTVEGLGGAVADGFTAQTYSY